MKVKTVKELKQILDDFESELEVFLLGSGGLMPIESADKQGNIIVIKSNDDNY